MYISATVRTEAKREHLEQTKKGRLKIAVREAAERNQANRRVLELVAAHFGLPKGKVRIISGHTSTAKIFSIDLPG